MTRQESKAWAENHPIGTAVSVTASPYVVEPGDHGQHRVVCQNHYEASIIITRPFVFAGQSCVKLFGYGERPIFISRLKAL